HSLVASAIQYLIVLPSILHLIYLVAVLPQDDTLSLHDALPIYGARERAGVALVGPLVEGGVHRNEGARERALAEQVADGVRRPQDRKSTRLNSSHGSSSYAVFGLKKKSEMVHVIAERTRGGYLQ